MTEPDEALLWAREQSALPAVQTVTAHAYRAGAAASAERIKELERALINTGASLLAATSLLENGGKKAAPSDKMFKIMLSDYRAAADRAAALLKETDQ